MPDEDLVGDLSSPSLNIFKLFNFLYYAIDTYIYEDIKINLLQNKTGA